MYNFLNSDSQNVLYYLILLFFLASGLFMGRKINISQSLKYLAIWTVIALIAVVLYAYRYEFTDFKNRILGELSPMSVQNDNQGRVIINMSRDGHFYINIKVNGRTVRFLVDTGASDIALNLKDAKNIGIDVKKLRYNKSYNTANGVILGASVNLGEVALGDIRFYGVNATVNSANLDVSLLGMSFLSRFRKYEINRNKLILER